MRRLVACFALSVACSGGDRDTNTDWKGNCPATLESAEELACKNGEAQGALFGSYHACVDEYDPNPYGADCSGHLNEDCCDYPPLEAPWDLWREELVQRREDCFRETFCSYTAGCPGMYAECGGP